MSNAFKGNFYFVPGQNFGKLVHSALVIGISAVVHSFLDNLEFSKNFPRIFIFLPPVVVSLYKHFHKKLNHLVGPNYE